MFYTAWKMRVSAADYTCISGFWAIWGLCPDLTGLCPWSPQGDFGAVDIL